MDDSLKDLIQELTSSQLVINWLELCGFETLEDLEYLTESVVSDMESYIGSMCSAMTFDEREKYIHVNLFKKYPLQFKFPPCLKSRLLNATSAISKQFDKSSQIPRNRCLLSKYVQKFNSNHLIDNGYQIASQDLYENISENIKKNFNKTNNDQFNFDFDIFCCKTEEKNQLKHGFFSCSIDQNNEICGEYIKFFINSHDDSIYMESILAHMELHFDCKHDSINRFANNNNNNNIENDLNRSSRSFDLADGKLCNDHIHNEIIKLAHSKFINCQLTQNIDFNVYEIFDDDLSLTSGGCFVCYICLKNKSTESKIKFFFTGNRRIVFTNIVAHLRIHFQSIAPVSTTVSKKRFLPPIKSHFGKSLKINEMNSMIKNSPFVKLETTEDKENLI